MTEETLQTDILIIGAGPAGLSAAIRLGQLAKESGQELSVMVLEKGASVGAHIVSGAVLEPRALDELIPDWQDKGAPIHTAVTSDSFQFLTQKTAIPLPTPPDMKNHGNHIISLGHLCQWLGEQAEALGIQILPGYAAKEAWIEDGAVKGVITGAFGVDKNGEHKPQYQPPIHIEAKMTLFAEGCRGHISEQLMDTFNLRADCEPQTYAIGLKELWKITPEKHSEGKVLHTIGWPLDSRTYGGSFMYHGENNTLSLGLVVGLDYQNPYLDPFAQLQRFKTHPTIAVLLAGGERIAFAARALNEGGLQSIPKLTFAGGALIGCAAGLLNVPKIKGTHTAMKSGMLAAEAAFEAINNESNIPAHYEEKLKNSWVFEELTAARNIRPAFKKGLLAGLLYSAFDSFILRGKAPWTFTHGQPDYASLKDRSQCQPIDYPKPDGILTFDRASSVYLTSTAHEENQPCHLQLADADIPIAHNLAQYDAPEQRYCPAGVYEIIEQGGKDRLHINAANCIHCKTCDIKDPTQNIHWTVPEGGGGPNYSGM